MIIFRNVLHMSIMSVLNRQLNGFRHMPTMDTIANSVKPATACLNINSIFIMKTCSNRQMRNIASRIAAIYNKDE